MWVKFEQLIQLCHAYRHWQQVSLKKRFPPLFAQIFVLLLRAVRRQDEWKREIHQSERHMYDAALLAADKMADMSLLVSDVDSDERQDCKLYSALTLAVAPFPKHERDRFSAVAFRAFDADCELQGRPEEIASRWLGHAGYRGANLRADASLLPTTPTPTRKNLDGTWASNSRSTG
jgi:hypothetical protein